MYKNFLKQYEFTSVEDFKENLEFVVPDDFNFAYDVMDRWAEEWPEGKAIIWVNDKGDEKIVTYPSSSTIGSSGKLSSARSIAVSAADLTQ